MTRATAILMSLLSSVAVLWLLTGLAGCGGSGTGEPDPRDRSTEPVHCVPEVPACH